ILRERSTARRPVSSIYGCASFRSFPVEREEAGASIRHRQAAADAQHLSCDVIRPAAQEKHHGLGDFNRPSDPAKRYGSSQRLLHPLGLALEEWGVSRSGGDAVNVDVVARELA